ncbi:MAG: hypothetical protein WCV41_04700 [Patescibacteria group bacterium]
MKEKILHNWRIIILTILSVIFFYLYSWYPYQTAKETDFKFASPDETANYFWTQKISGLTAGDALESRYGSVLSYFEPLNLIADDAVMPRSMRSDDGIVKPVSFLGIILIYGMLAKIFSSWIIIYLTPLFAIIGVFCFYGIIKRIFPPEPPAAKNIALLSALMLFALAPYWYYASRSMFHNVLFIDLLLIGTWLFITGKDAISLRIGKARIRTDFVFIFLSGIFIGLAIIARASELIWLGLVMFICWFAYFKQIGRRKLTVFICGVVLALLPMFYYNQVLYGNWHNFGYSQTVEQAQNEVAADNINAVGAPAEQIRPQYAAPLKNKINKFLPAEINIKQAGKSFIYYYAIIFWYLFWPAFFGGVWLSRNWKKIDKPQKLYLIVFIISSVILGLYYGSWEIHDNPNKNSTTIGNSYTRYFLPMYIMSLPLAALIIVKLSALLRNKYLIYGAQAAVIIAFFVLNFQAAVLAKEEGLLVMKDNLIKDANQVKNISSQIESEAVIISERFDKFFWPEHKVIVGNLSDKSRPSAYAKLAEQGTPLYYYGFIFPPGDLAYLNSRKLSEFNLELEIIRLDEENRMGLYRLLSL